MDPTIRLIEIKNSFSRTREDRDKKISYPPAYSADNRDLPILNIILSDKYPKYARIKNNEKGPFSPSKIGNSIFIDFDAVKLSNLDSVFKFSGRQGGMYAPQELKKFVYIGIETGEGGYHQYLQYRLPLCYGYSIDKIGFKKTNEEYIDMRKSRFKKIVGNGKRGDITTDYDSMINEIGEHVDLIISNMISDRKKVIKFICAETILALTRLNRNGYWIFQIKDVDDAIKDLLYLISLVFDRITIFKPLASYYLDDYSVIVEGPRQNMNEMILLMNNIIKIEGYTQRLVNERSNAFEVYLDNSLNIINQVNYETIYRYEKALILWNVPGKLENPEKNPLIYTYGKKRDEADPEKKITYDVMKQDDINVIINKQEATIKERQLYEQSQQIESTRIESPRISSPDMLSPYTMSPERQSIETVIPIIGY